MHKVAYRIAAYSVDQGWIDDDELEICCYSFERRLLAGLFLLTQLLIYAPLGKLPEAFIFITVALPFRRRMGGIHANSVWLCQIISTASVIISVLILGPLVGQLPPLVIFVGNTVLITCAFFLVPSYPPQVHFTQQDIDGNIQRIHLMLVTLILAQVVSIQWFDMLYIVYSSIGLLFVIITVILG